MNENKDKVQYPESVEIPMTKTKRFVGARTFSLMKESGLVDEKKFTVDGWKTKFEAPFVKMIYAECGITDAPAEVCNIDGLFASFVEALKIAGIAQESLGKLEEEMEKLTKKDEEVYNKLSSLKSKFDKLREKTETKMASQNTALSGTTALSSSNNQTPDPAKMADFVKSFESFLKAFGLPKPPVPTDGNSANV